MDLVSSHAAPPDWMDWRCNAANRTLALAHDLAACCAQMLILRKIGKLQCPIVPSLQVIVNKIAHVAELADALDSGFHFCPFFQVASHHLKLRKLH
jgi:hypothetical protein